jgi:hypothetical protein
MKKLLLIQPGAFGDIFVCAPIAKWYADRGYEVHWPVRQKFVPTLQYFDYVKPIVLSEDSLHSDWLRSDVMKTLHMIKNYDKVVNLADRGPHPTAQLPYENFEQCKYRIAEIPFEEKHNLVWSRNLEKEKSLLISLNIDKEKPYAVAHLVDSKNEKINMIDTKLPVYEISEQKDYNIFDWYTIIMNAKEVYAIESAIHQFIDGFIKNTTSKNYLLKRSSVSQGYRYTQSKYWNLDIIGKNSEVRG